MKLSVCSVTKYECELSDFNLNHLLRNNSNIEFEFLIINNSRNFRYTVPNVRQFSGIPSRACFIGKNDVYPPHKLGRYSGSLQHGFSLEKLINQTASKYIILIDPDFFLYVPIRTLIDYMENTDTSVIGTPYGIPNKHNHISNFQNPNYYNLANCMFCIINKDVLKNDLLFSSRNYDRSLMLEEKVADTSYPFRQKQYKYKYHSLITCINPNCNICQEIVPKADSFFDLFLEKFFFFKYFVGVHLHVGSQIRFSKVNLRYIYEYISKIKIKDVYHPLNNYYSDIVDGIAEYIKEKRKSYALN